jgi:hypothetical protein
MVSSFGTESLAAMTDHLTASITGQSPRKQSTKDMEFVNTLQKIRVIGALALKPASVLKQLVSAGRFSTAQDVTIKDWLKGFVPISKDELEFMVKIFKSDYVRRRFRGRGIDLEATRILDNNRGSKFDKGLAEMTQESMIFTRIGDIGGVLIGGSSYGLSIYRSELKKGATKEDALQRFQKILNSLQLHTKHLTCREIMLVDCFQHLQHLKHKV